MIAITDSGIGMSADVREKVFEPFFTTKEVGKGTGLGLSMVYGFVKQSGGHINICSEKGFGTTIRLYLPAIGEPADAPVPMVAPIRGAGETILVVEDDELVRGFVIAQLESLGYRTIAAANSRAALRYLEIGQPFDLLFTDVVMPGGMTGPQLAAEIARRRPGIRILYTSGYTGSAVAQHWSIEQGVMLLSKPYRKSELSGMLRLAFDGAAAKTYEAAIRPADTSIVVQMRPQLASAQALSSG